MSKKWEGKKGGEDLIRYIRYEVVYKHIHRFLRRKGTRYFILFFVLGSICTLVASSFVSMKPYRNYLFLFNYLASAVFFAEYVLRIIASPVSHPGRGIVASRFRYAFSFFGIIDFIAVLPFVLIYFFHDQDNVHMVVLAYVLSIFKLIRYSKAFLLIGKVIATVKNELATAYTACGIMICFSGICMYFVEHKAQPDAFANIADGFWWAIVTFATVGYGDIYPVTVLGRLLSSVISLLGIAMIAIPTAIITSAFMNYLNSERKKIESKGSDGDKDLDSR